MVENWNAVNNDYSQAIVELALVQELLWEFGCDLQGVKGGTSFRGTCPVHSGDGQNFTVETDGHTLPLRWACHSHQCHKQAPLKNNLLGLVRGALTGDPMKPASLPKAKQFLKEFLLAHNGNRPFKPSTPFRRRSSQRMRTELSWSREQVRDHLIIVSVHGSTVWRE